MIAKYGKLLLKIDSIFQNMEKLCHLGTTHSNHITMHKTTIYRLIVVIGQGTEVLVLLVQYIFGENFNFMHMSVTSTCLLAALVTPVIMFITKTKLIN